LFTKVRFTDLLITGEMRHHDVLAKVASGAAVVLTDHTNTERGYLPILARRLERGLSGVTVVVSRCDVDPLRVV
jgi:putative NIF3 family GTP cyclohydrolase 1 type 2